MDEKTFPVLQMHSFGAKKAFFLVGRMVGVTEEVIFKSDSPR